ncbi:hypothetical protein N0V93_006289 [Gnomoniopsis smithogilvyi]|uniref:Uncharacterized protein n=1 Tax=Gnomoniopsis smithogilvyi TaxID=1191159 RepID=A0A9W8YRE4_9PEZI|nr:hypothetical protein N0V93_006289 [Gnomoniopsis smithogilvyi]
MPWEDKRARPLADDQVSLGSYHSDAYTLPCDPFEDDVRSQHSRDSYDSSCHEAELPSYRVPTDQGVSQPVYEAWIIYYSDSQDAMQKTSFCGFPVCTRYAESSPYVSCITEPYAQDDLAAMTRTALQGYQSAHKRSFPSRFLRNRPKSYEADLDARIQKLPRPVQSELDGLLGDREAATGNRFHKRDWTVAMMREQYRYRFATAEYEEVKKRDNRFWKKSGTKRPSEYFFIIRGGEGRVAVDDTGMQTATRHGNPWKRVDELEQARKTLARVARRYGKDHEPAQVRLRDRSLSPPPRRVHLESEAPASPAPRFPNPFTPDPQFAMPPPPPLPGVFGPFPLHRPWRASPGMPRPCPYISSMGRHPPLAPFPPPLPMGSFPYDFTGMAFPPPPPPPPPPAPPSVPMAPPPFLTSYSRRPPPPTGSKINLQSFNSNSPANNEALFDFDFDAFLRGADTIPPQSTGSSHAFPPPAPRLSNLTTPTTFSPATSARDEESSVDGTEVSTPVDAESLELRVEEEGSSGRTPWDE